VHVAKWLDIRRTESFYLPVRKSILEARDRVVFVGARVECGAAQSKRVQTAFQALKRNTVRQDVRARHRITFTWNHIRLGLFHNTQCTKVREDCWSREEGLG
jgi:hypothetical protein